MYLLGMHSYAIRLLALSAVVGAVLDCRPNGPVIPRPRNLAQSDIFRIPTESLTQSIQQALSGEVADGWPVEHASFSLAVVSAHQPDPAVPVWEYHHLSSANTNGTKDLSRDSQYLVGSVTKVISDLMLIKSGIDLDDPIVKYIPDLNSS